MRMFGVRGVEMIKRILNYIQLSLQGVGIAALGTLNIYEPRTETLIFGGLSLLGGLLVAALNKRIDHERYDYGDYFCTGLDCVRRCTCLA